MQTETHLIIDIKAKSLVWQFSRICDDITERMEQSVCKRKDCYSEFDSLPSTIINLKFKRYESRSKRQS